MAMLNASVRLDLRTRDNSYDHFKIVDEWTSGCGELHIGKAHCC